MKPFLGCSATITIGCPVFHESDARGRPFGVVFEDDGRTGYFYARDYMFPRTPFVDALHIYTVDQVPNAGECCKLRILWTLDWSKAALLISDEPHAMFDFCARIGFSRDAFPDPDPNSGWSRKPWSTDLKSFFYSSE